MYGFIFCNKVLANVCMTTLQVTVLDDAVKHHPDAWWWLKTDGVDINQGLQESLQHQWSGDVDLNDGGLQK